MNLPRGKRAYLKVTAKGDKSVRSTKIQMKKTSTEWKIS